MEPGGTEVAIQAATKVVAFQWRHLLFCNGSLSLELVGLVTLLVAGFQTTSNGSFYFKIILSKLVCLLMSLPFQGEVLRTKVKKICEGFHAAVYACPEVTFVP